MFRSFNDFQQRRPLISDYLIGFRPLNGEFKVYFGDVLDLATSAFIDTVTLSAQSIARSITGTQFFQSQSTYSTVNTNSGRWFNTFLPLSGGELTGDLLIQGSLSALGTISYIDTKVIVMSALTITNPGTGPAIQVNQIGAQPIAEFQDDGLIAMYIADGGNVGIKTTTPQSTLHVIGDVTVSNGLTALSLSASQITVTAGTSAVPAISPVNDTNTGIYFPAADTIAFSTSGVEAMRINSSGNVGIGITPSTKLHVDGTIRYTSRPAAGTITAIGFDANGDLKASSSSLRYKHDIEDYGKGLAEVMQLRPVSFKFNGEENVNVGFIAEEVDALGLTEVMLYNQEKQPESIIYTNMISLLTKAIQQLKTENDSLKARITALEAT